MSDKDNRWITSETGDSIYQGALITVGVIGSTFALKKVGGKKMAPDLSSRDLVTLGIAVMASRFGIDYMYRKYYNG